MSMLRSLLAAITLLWSSVSFGQGVINVALTQQVNANGIPLAGALLYVYQVGTVATPQNTFQDFGLTLTNPWPLQADSTGRIPMFYLANGQVHVRLTDASGVVIFDYPTMQVVGPSSGGGGGGGGAVDPTSVATTGDVKFRPTSEVLTGWVRLNGQTIGNTGSGASNTGTQYQALYVYLWTNCPNAHCAVSTGRGMNALADFGANKTMTMPDWRGRTTAGLDQMGAGAPAGRIAASNVTSGGGDGVDTPQATGGEANHALTIAELAAHNHTATDSGHTHQFTDSTQGNLTIGGGQVAVTQIQGSGSGGANVVTTQSGTANITVTNTGSGTAHNTMSPFMLGTWYMKL